MWCKLLQHTKVQKTTYGSRWVQRILVQFGPAVIPLPSLSARPLLSFNCLVCIRAKTCLVDTYWSVSLIWFHFAAQYSHKDFFHFISVTWDRAPIKNKRRWTVLICDWLNSVSSHSKIHNIRQPHFTLYCCAICSSSSSIFSLVPYTKRCPTHMALWDTHNHVQRCR